MVLCIGREFGSGGHAIGERLARQLGMEFFDHALIDAAQKSGLNPSTLEKADEAKVNPFLYSAQYDATDSRFRGLSVNDALFEIQSEFMVEAAKKGPCVIVGRCGDYVLEQAGIPRTSLFITAPFADRVRRKMELEGLGERETAALVRKKDKRRKAYYDYHTGYSWGKPHNYDLCISTAPRGIEATADLLAALVRQLEG